MTSAFLVWLFSWMGNPGLAFGVEGSPHVHVFYGRMQGSFQEKTRAYLSEDFEPRLQKLAAANGFLVRLHPNAETPELIDAMADPATLGVFWIGHPGLLIEDGQLLNSFIQTASGVFVPKSIGSAAHGRFKFFGLVSCHFSDLLKRYHAPSFTFPWFTPQAHELDRVADRDDVLAELTSIFLAPRNVLEQIEPKLAEWTRMFSDTPFESGPTRTLTIQYRDLLSSKFTYELLWNQNLIGFLSKTDRAGGLLRFQIPASPGRLTIRPDDANRARKSTDPLHLVDDILIDAISTERQLLEHPIHIGDDTGDWDRDTKTSFLSNHPDFKRYPPQSHVEIDIP